MSGRLKLRHPPLIKADLNGDFKKQEDRVRAMQYAMRCGFVDAVTIGFASTVQIDEALENTGAALSGRSHAA